MDSDGIKMSKADNDLFISSMQKSLLFRHLALPELKFVATNSRLRKFDAGQQLYKEGEPADFFFVVHSGAYHETGEHALGSRATRRMHKIIGHTFGSHELLFPQARKTSVHAAEAGMCWSIPKRVFDSKLKVYPPPSKKLLAFMKHVSLFSDLSEEELHQLARAATDVRLREDMPVCEQGEPALSVYAVRQGIVEARQNGSDHVMTIQAPQVFGESALYSDEGLRVRMANVSCVRDPSQYESPGVHGHIVDTTLDALKDKLEWKGAIVVSFASADIEALVGFALQGAAERAFNRKMLETVRIGNTPITTGLNREQADWMAERMVEHIFVNGERVCTEGKDAECSYVVKRGKAVVSTKEAGDVAEITTGAFFGELALLGRKGKRSATVTAKGEIRLLSLGSDVVRSNRLLDQWRRAMEAAFDEVRQKNEKENTAAAEVMEKEKKKQEEQSVKERLIKRSQRHAERTNNFEKPKERPRQRGAAPSPAAAATKPKGDAATSSSPAEAEASEKPKTVAASPAPAAEAPTRDASKKKKDALANASDHSGGGGGEAKRERRNSFALLKRDVKERRDSFTAAAGEIALNVQSGAKGVARRLSMSLSNLFGAGGDENEKAAQAAAAAMQGNGDRPAPQERRRSMVQELADGIAGLVGGGGGKSKDGERAAPKERRRSMVQELADGVAGLVGGGGKPNRAKKANRAKVEM